MSIHELSTCHRYGIGVKVVVINNQWLGMVRQWQDMVYQGRRADSQLGEILPQRSSGWERQTPIPDFVSIAQGEMIPAGATYREYHHVR